MKKVNIGILGYANIAKKAIIPAIQASNNFKLYGIASRNVNNREEIEESYKCKFFPDYQSLVTNLNLDAIYIPLPNSLHFQWAKKALEAGKHLLVEKSLACTLDEVKRLNQIAKQMSLALIENFQFRKHSQLKTIKEIIASKQLGEIRSITSSFGFPPFSDKNNIRYKKELGGGALLDAGAYPIKLSQELLGSDVEISSAVLNYGDSEVDIWGGGMIKDTKSQNFLQFSFGFDHFYQCSLEIWGSKAKLFTNRIFTAPPGYQPKLTIENHKDKQTITLDADNHFINMLEHFYNCTKDANLRKYEYDSNLNQSKLLGEFQKIANQEIL